MVGNNVILKLINRIAISASILLIIFSGLYILGAVSLVGRTESYIQAVLIVLSAALTLLGRGHDLNQLAYKITVVALIGVITMYGWSAILLKYEQMP
ncbi:hypothetical protein bcgnr5390_61280 [Bacillus luti]|nr:hypothetical protein BC2903_60980 [Bacillus cereus]